MQSEEVQKLAALYGPRNDIIAYLSRLDKQVDQVNDVFISAILGAVFGEAWEPSEVQSLRYTLAGLLKSLLVRMVGNVHNSGTVTEAIESSCNHLLANGFGCINIGEDTNIEIVEYVNKKLSTLPHSIYLVCIDGLMPLVMALEAEAQTKMPASTQAKLAACTQRWIQQLKAPLEPKV